MAVLCPHRLREHCHLARHVPFRKTLGPCQTCGGEEKHISMFDRTVERVHLCGGAGDQQDGLRRSLLLPFPPSALFMLRDYLREPIGKTEGVTFVFFQGDRLCPQWLWLEETFSYSGQKGRGITRWS